MDIYLPIAEVSLDIFVLLGLGAAVGFLSGVFGVGGGFLIADLAGHVAGRVHGDDRVERRGDPRLPPVRA